MSDAEGRVDSWPELRAENTRLLAEITAAEDLHAALTQQHQEAVAAWQEAQAETASIRAEYTATLGFAQTALAALVKECDALKADLARVSAEMGLPPGIGPAPGELARLLASLPARRAPVACSSCNTPIAKYIEPGAEWHPCRDCDGSLCEKCCDAKKARPA